MAERRMFAKSIVLSDAFLDMPMSARCLYFTLGMLADDDGFIGNPKSIMRQCGASQDDMLVLLQKRYLLSFESGVIVIKHWRMNNYLKNDRHKETTYIEEKATLTLDQKGAYTECLQNGYNLDTEWIPSGDTGKDSIDKNSIDKNIRHQYGEYKNVLLDDKDYEKLQNEFPSDYQERIDNLSRYMRSTGKSYKDHLATIRNWARMEKKRNEKVGKTANDQIMTHDYDIAEIERKMLGYG